MKSKIKEINKRIKKVNLLLENAYKAKNNNDRVKLTMLIVIETVMITLFIHEVKLIIYDFVECYFPKPIRIQKKEQLLLPERCYTTYQNK